MLIKNNSLDKLLFPLLPLSSDEVIKSHCHSFCHWKCLPSQPAICLWPQDFSLSWGTDCFCKGLMLTLWWTFLLGEAPVLLPGPFVWFEHPDIFQDIQSLPCLHTRSSAPAMVLCYGSGQLSMLSSVSAMGLVMRTGSKWQKGGPLLGLLGERCEPGEGPVWTYCLTLSLCAADIGEGN